MDSIMTLNRICIIISCITLLGACATPPEVKALSSAQVGYFDSAIKAVSAQSEALILAAEEIEKQAVARIEERDRKNEADLKKLLLENTGATPADRERLVDATLQSVTKAASISSTAKENLQRSLAEIKAKSGELRAYLDKMKQVQVALDAFLQSESAGEQILHDVLGHSSVANLLSTASDLATKTAQTSLEVKGLLEDLKT